MVLGKLPLRLQPLLLQPTLLAKNAEGAFGKDRGMEVPAVAVVSLDAADSARWDDGYTEQRGKHETGKHQVSKNSGFNS